MSTLYAQFCMLSHHLLAPSYSIALPLASSLAHPHAPPTCVPSSIPAHAPSCVASLHVTRMHALKLHLHHCITTIIVACTPVCTTCSCAATQVPYVYMSLVVTARLHTLLHTTPYTCFIDCCQLACHFQPF